MKIGEKMSIIFPEYVVNVLKTLENNGYEAFAVGGAVRDLLMGKTPYDFDITTNAEPTAVMSLFEKTVPTGIKHGTVTVVTDCGNIEVTTYRTDEGYTDHRKPDEVKFIKSIDEDLIRRDFTVNSICWSPLRGIYDKNGGINDINKKIIRTVGDPQKRFSEDALRIMRAFRFSAQLGFTIEENTKSAALKLSCSLSLISAERIASELKKIFLSPFPQNADGLFLSGAFENFGIPKAGIPKKLPLLPYNFPLRYAAFIKNEKATEKSLKLLKFDNITINSAVNFAKQLSAGLPSNKADIKKLIGGYGKDFTVDLINYFKIYGQNTDDAEKYLKEIEINREITTVGELQINGNDLKALGYKGKEIGEKLQKLLELCICEKLQNTKEDLIFYLRFNK